MKKPPAKIVLYELRGAKRSTTHSLDFRPHLTTSVLIRSKLSGFRELGESAGSVPGVSCFKPSLTSPLRLRNIYSELISTNVEAPGAGSFASIRKAAPGLHRRPWECRSASEGIAKLCRDENDLPIAFADRAFAASDAPSAWWIQAVHQHPNRSAPANCETPVIRGGAPPKARSDHLDSGRTTGM